MQNYDIECFFLKNNSLIRCEYLPLGINDIAMEWRFSEKFPIGLNASISNESLKFIKSDRDFLIHNFLTYGEGAEIYFILRIRGRDFKLILDFSAAQWDESYFECGAKGTPLQDILTNLSKEKKKLTFFSSEFSSKLLINNAITKVEGKSSSQKDVYFEYINAVNDKVITTVGNINELNCSDLKTYGYKINMPIQPPEPTFITVDTDNKMLIPSNFTSLFSFRAINNLIYDYRKIKFKFYLNYKMLVNDPTRIRLQFCYSKSYNDGTPNSYHNISHIDKYCSYGGSYYLLFNFDEIVNIQKDFGNNVSDIYFHFYLYVIDERNGVGANLKSKLMWLKIEDFELETNLGGLHLHAKVVSLKNYLEKINETNDVFDISTLTNEMLSCDLTNINFAKRALPPLNIGLKFYVDINDLLQSISILYNVAIVEDGGKFKFIELSKLKNIPSVRMNERTEPKYTNSTNYDKLSIGTKRGDIKYQFNIFGEKTFAQINNRITNDLDLSTKILSSGEKIFELFQKGENNEETMILHSISDYHILNHTDLTTQFINEYFANIAVLRRLSPFLSSYFARKNKLEGDTDNIVLTNVPDTNNPPFNILDNGIVTLNDMSYGTDFQIFEHYNAIFSVPFKTENLLSFIEGCKLLRFNNRNELYLPIKINVNFEANTIDVECKILR